MLPRSVEAVGMSSHHCRLSVVACVREEDKEKEKEARKLYEGFVRRKDETRIRLPTNVTPDAKVTSTNTPTQKREGDQRAWPSYTHVQAIMPIEERRGP